MGFPQDFTPKIGGKYTMNNLESGQTVRFRVMTDFISGNVVWSDPAEGEEKGKPYRAPEGVEIPEDKVGTNRFGGGKNPIRQFIAAVVWNYDSGQFEIFETDKQSIISELWKYDQDEDYGSASSYDVKITKTGSGKTTRYEVKVSPPKDITKDILEAYNDVGINLKALLKNEDPFDSSALVDEVTEALGAGTN
jgi:hypothetical protein